MYQPGLPAANSIVDQHIGQLYNYYRNIAKVGNNLYSMQFQILPNRQEMLQLQMYYFSFIIQQHYKCLYIRQIPIDYPHSPPRLSAKGFRAPPFIDPVTTQVRNIKTLTEWAPGSFTLLNIVGELHSYLINYAKQPQAFDLSYQATQHHPP